MSAVYFIREESSGAIKIGVAKDVYRRLSFLRTAHSSELTLLGVIAGDGLREAALHRQFQHIRLRGEWFRPEPDLLALIAQEAACPMQPRSRKRAELGQTFGFTLLVDISIARIRAYAQHMGWTRNRLATEAGLAESTIRAIESAEWSPTADTLRRLEGIIPEDFSGPEPKADAA
jgi:DNA-binding XRE family transcriptional regulator